MFLCFFIAGRRVFMLLDTPVVCAMSSRTTRLLVTFTAAAIALAVTPSTAQSQTDCPDWASDRSTRTALSIDALTESSGLAWHPDRPDILWTHNDSGNRPRLFALGMKGEHRATVTLPDEVSNTDWEDISAGECPGEASGACVAVGDIGDNRSERDSVSVYWIRLPQPEQVDAAAKSDTETDVQAEVEATWRVTYEDGARNAEALFIDPDGDAIWIVEKALDGRAGVYRVAPTEPGGTDVEAAAERRATIDLDHFLPLGRTVTAAALGPDRRSVMLRTYLSVRTFRLDGNTSFDAWPEASSTNTPTPLMLQSEALTHVNGKTLAMTSEGTPSSLVTMALSAKCRPTTSP